MSHTLVTYTVKPGCEEENTALVRAVFDELAQTRPEGLPTKRPPADQYAQRLPVEVRGGLRAARRRRRARRSRCRPARVGTARRGYSGTTGDRES